MKAGHKQIS